MTPLQEPSLEARWTQSSNGTWSLVATLWVLIALLLCGVTVEAGLREMWTILVFWTLLGGGLVVVILRTDLGIRIDGAGFTLLRRIHARRIAWSDVAEVRIGATVAHQDGARIAASLAGMAVAGPLGAAIGRGLTSVAVAAVASQTRDARPNSLKEAIASIGTDRAGLDPTLEVVPRDGKRPIAVIGRIVWDFAREAARSANGRGVRLTID